MNSILGHHPWPTLTVSQDAPWHEGYKKRTVLDEKGERKWVWQKRWNEEYDCITGTGMWNRGTERWQCTPNCFMHCQLSSGISASFTLQKKTGVSRRFHHKNRLKTNFAVLSQCTRSPVKSIFQRLQVLEDLQVTFDVIFGKVLIIKNILIVLIKPFFRSEVWTFAIFLLFWNPEAVKNVLKCSVLWRIF